MIYEKVGKKLVDNGYGQMYSNVPEIYLYYKEEEGRARVLPLFHYHDQIHFTQEQYIHLKEQIKELFHKRGNHSIEILCVLCTEKVEEVKEIFVPESGTWIIDTRSQRLLIFENQPKDFYGVKFLMDEILAGNLLNQSYSEKARIKESFDVKKFLKEKPVCNGLIIIINIIVFLILEWNGSTKSAEYMLSKGALAAPMIFQEGEYYRLITSLFMHFGIEHLFNNMLVLFFIGNNLEGVIGKIKYSLIYLISGVSGSVFSLLLTSTKEGIVVSAGASGAVFGIMGGLFWVVIINRGRLENLTSRRLGFLIILTLYQGFTSTGVDNFAHVGGMIAGAILTLLLYRKNKTRAS